MHLVGTKKFVRQNVLNIKQQMLQKSSAHQDRDMLVSRGFESNDGCTVLIEQDITRILNCVALYPGRVRHGQLPFLSRATFRRLNNCGLHRRKPCDIAAQYSAQLTNTLWGPAVSGRI